MSRQVAARSAIGVIALAGIVPGAIGTAHAALIQPGFQYQMFNHPAAQEDPPPYGLRLDELVDVTPGHDIFTWDFEHDDSNGISLALLSIKELPNFPNRFVIDIKGTVYGGLTDGNGYANDPAHVGFWDIDFTYIVGVKKAFADDDYIVDPDAPSMLTNAGTITGPGPGGITYLIGDVKDGEYSFRLGDENNDQGHQGFDGFSGWGWLKHGVAPPLQDIALSDWLFTLDDTAYPTPGALGLLGIAGLCGARRSRRDAR